MKIRYLVLIALGLIIHLFGRLTPIAVHSESPQAIAGYVDETKKQNALRATVRMLMFFPAVDNGQELDDQQSMVFTAAVGLGTLVSHNGDVFIVTHDHWGHALSELALVEFRNARDELLLEVNGTAFGRLIRHQDSGTMIIKAPAELLAYQTASLLPVQVKVGGAELTNSGDQSVAAGDIVQVVRQSPENPNEADVLAASVTAIGTRNGLVTLELHSLDGQSIVPGDSGGGVFHDGRLVGNLWSTEMATGKRYFGFLTLKSEATGTNLSTVAGLPTAAIEGS